jgi:hypothetical protein
MSHTVHLAGAQNLREALEAQTLSGTPDEAADW